MFASAETKTQNKFLVDSDCTDVTGIVNDSLAVPVSSLPNHKWKTVFGQVGDGTLGIDYGVSQDNSLRDSHSALSEHQGVQKMEDDEEEKKRSTTRSSTATKRKQKRAKRNYKKKKKQQTTTTTSSSTPSTQMEAVKTTYKKSDLSEETKLESLKKKKQNNIPKQSIYNALTKDTRLSQLKKPKQKKQ